MKLISATMKLFFWEKFHCDLKRWKMGRFKSLRFDFYVFNFDTMKVILFGKSAEKPCVKWVVPKRKGAQVSYQYLRSDLVEMGGIEPPSESALTGTSPGADGYLHSRALAWAVTLQGLVASWFMARSKLCVRTCTTKRRLIRTRGPVRSDGYVKPQRERRYRCSLIYKLPILRMLGASARYFCLRTPVETGTSPFFNSFWGGVWSYLR